jgi:hypothetical protein
MMEGELDIEAAMAARPAGMSGATVLKIIFGGDNVRANSYGEDPTAIPVIEFMGCREYFEPLVSWQQHALPCVEATAFAQACIDSLRAAAKRAAKESA